MNQKMLDIGNLSSSDCETLDLATIESLAQVIVSRGMSSPAIFILEIYKPLANVFTSLALVAYPFLIPLFGSERYSKAIQILKSPQALNQLMTRIEDLDHNQRGL
jgi:hypothetical protein